MSLNEFPDLKSAFEKLTAEKEKLVKQVKPLRDEYDQVVAQMEPLKAKARELAQKFHAIERPRLIEIDQQLSAISRATGGKVLSQGE